MKQSIKQILFTSIALALLLAACAPAPAPTPDATEIANQVATSVALTVASQNLETAQAEPTVTETPLPTATLVDTPTAVPPINTATPIVLPTSTSSGGGGGGGGSNNNNDGYACSVTFRRPTDNTIYKPNTNFDIKWTIENTGTKVIRAGTDLKFSTGTQMIKGTNRVELPDLDPGEDHEVDFDAVSPSKEGDYVMTYIVEGGLCYPYIVIKVQK